MFVGNLKTEGRSLVTLLYSYLKRDQLGCFKIIRFVTSGSLILALLVNCYVFFIFLQSKLYSFPVRLFRPWCAIHCASLYTCISTFSRRATLLYIALSFSSRPTQSHFSPREFERITTTNNVHIKQYWPLYNRFKHNAVMKNQINHVSLNDWTLEPIGSWVKQDWN